MIASLGNIKIIERLIEQKIRMEYKEYVSDIEIVYHSGPERFEIGFSMEEHIFIAEKLANGSNFLYNLGQKIADFLIDEIPNLPIISLNVYLKIIQPIDSIEINIEL